MDDVLGLLLLLLGGLLQVTRSVWSLQKESCGNRVYWKPTGLRRDYLWVPLVVLGLGFLAFGNSRSSGDRSFALGLLSAFNRPVDVDVLIVERIVVGWLLYKEYE